MGNLQQGGSDLPPGAAPGGHGQQHHHHGGGGQHGGGGRHHQQQHGQAAAMYPYGDPGKAAGQQQGGYPPGGGGGGGAAGVVHHQQTAAFVPASMVSSNVVSSGDGSDMPRSPSDASMTIMDGDSAHHHAAAAAAAAAAGGGGAAGTGGAGGAPTALDTSILDDDTVPTVFRWEHGGRQVYITGTFNGWSRQIPMHRSGNDFTYIHNLKRGKHAFKFIVDDEWRFAPDQPTVADIEGRINNFIDVTDFKPYTGDKEFGQDKAAAEYGVLGPAEGGGAEPSHGGGGGDGAEGAGGGAGGPAGAGGAAAAAADGGGAATAEDGTGQPGSGHGARPDRDGEVFSHTMPDMDEFTKEPPPLPPHLRHIILNKPPQLQDTAALPVPQHVALNHLYCTAIKDNMMVLGITQRYKTKFVTTVYYSPCASK